MAGDTAGLVLNEDGSFWVSEEYGPYIYHFSPSGKMLSAIAPPSSVTPRRNGTISFSANSPPRYDAGRKVIPKDPDSGRGNNKGLEGLPASPCRCLFITMEMTSLSKVNSNLSARPNFWCWREMVEQGGDKGRRRVCIGMQMSSISLMQRISRETSMIVRRAASPAKRVY